MQNQLVCSGCRTILLYPGGGATNVRCALCNTVTPIPAPGTGMAQLVCGGCRTLLMYRAGAASVRCSCCQTLNHAPASNQLAHINCGNCRTMLMYPYGAPSVKCALCHYVTCNDANRLPLPAQRLNGLPASGTMSSTSQTVLVENPMSIDESGKLVSNVVVGVTTSKRFFVVANAMASLHNLCMMVAEVCGKKFVNQGRLLSVVAILDMMTVALVSAGVHAAAFMAELGKNGNKHARWNKICDKFEEYCNHGGGALIASFIGLCLLLVIASMSILKLPKLTRDNNFSIVIP